VVTAADLLALAAHLDGHFAQAFPSFGSERTGAPVVSFCRLDDRPIRTRSPVVEPDAVVVLDPTLVHQVDLFSGLSTEGYVLVNTARCVDDLALGPLVGRFRTDRLQTVPATELARRHTGRAVPNAAILGAFAALTSEVSIGAVTTAIRDRFADAPTVAGHNAAAAAEAFNHIRRVRGETILEVTAGAQTN
jgi:pyruvate ferredoxin oxidoreductase gamma subunit